MDEVYLLKIIPNTRDSLSEEIPYVPRGKPPRQDVMESIRFGYAVWSEPRLDRQSDRHPDSQPRVCSCSQSGTELRALQIAERTCRLRE